MYRYATATDAASQPTEVSYFLSVFHKDYAEIGQFLSDNVSSLKIAPTDLIVINDNNDTNIGTFVIKL